MVPRVWAAVNARVSNLVTITSGPFRNTLGNNAQIWLKVKLYRLKTHPGTVPIGSSPAPACTLGRPYITRGSATPHMTPRARRRAHQHPSGRRALLCAIARRATSLATTAAARDMPHTNRRASSRTHRKRPGSRHDSAHSAYTGRVTIAADPTCVRDGPHGRRASRRVLRATPHTGVAPACQGARQR